MPVIRYTYGPDVRQFGEGPHVVEDVEARVLCDDMRRAVRVGPEELEQLKKDQLVEVAEKADVEVKKSAPKKQIAKAVAESEES